MTKPDFSALLNKSRANQNKRKEEEQGFAPLIASAHPLPNAAVKLPSQPTNRTNADEIHTKIGKYVRGEIAVKPDFSTLTVRHKIPQKVSFKTLLTKQSKHTDTKNDSSTVRDVLFGTGITKKETAKAQTIAKKSFNFLLKKETTPDAEAELETELQTELASAETIEAQPPIISLPIAPTATEIEWDEYQLAALEGLRVEKYGCLIGAAGTGKTTVMKQLIKELETTLPTIDLNRARLRGGEKPDWNISVCFCAFTGRAVQQMKRPLPREYHPMCNTIHATLGYAPETVPYQDDKTKEWKEKIVFRPTFTASNKLPYMACVVDEAGMVPIKLWNELLAALPGNARIILIGDINQLPPVQGRSVLGFAMLKWPTFTLEHIHRQAADNPIIANAHNILQGRFPQKDKAKFGMFTIADGSIMAFNHIVGYVQQCHKRGLFDPLRDALIVPQNKGTLGQVHLNERLVHYFNPPDKNKRYVITTGLENVTYAVGDKIMLLQNDRERALTNGMTGVIINIAINGQFKGELASHKFDASYKDVDMTGWENEMDDEDDDIDVGEKEDVNQRQSSHIVTVEFGDVDNRIEVPFNTAGQYRKICLAYAFTCHKSQGGEYPNVIIAIHASNIKMLTREWLYTAVTRARDKVIILYNDRGLAQAINIQRIKGRTVQEKAERFLALQDQSDTQLPNLPEPRKF